MPRERPIYLVLGITKTVGAGPSLLPEILGQSDPPYFKTHVGIDSLAVTQQQRRPITLIL